ARPGCSAPTTTASARSSGMRSMTRSRATAAPPTISPTPLGGWSASRSRRPAAELPRRPRPRPGLSLERQRVRTGLLFLAPTLIVAAGVAGWPLLRTVLLSFTDAQLSTIAQAQWVGTQNFASVLEDPDWWRSMWTTLGFSGASVALELALGLAF